MSCIHARDSNIDNIKIIIKNELNKSNDTKLLLLPLKTI